MILENRIEIIAAGTETSFDTISNICKIAMSYGFGGINVPGVFLEKIFNLRIERPPVSATTGIVNFESSSLNNLICQHYESISNTGVKYHNIGVNIFSLANGDLEFVYQELKLLNLKKKTRVFLDLGMIADETEVFRILNFCQELDFNQVIFCSTFDEEFDDEMVLSEAERFSRKINIPIGVWSDFKSIEMLGEFADVCKGSLILDYENVLEILDASV